MDLIRVSFILVILVYSGQSMALFMPAGFTIDTGTALDASNVADGGC